MAQHPHIEQRRLDPHDPLPESGHYVLVIRRFAEDQPNITRIEIQRGTGSGLPVEEPVTTEDFATAVREAEAIAAHHGIIIIYVVDRTAGPLEREVLSHHGDHSFTGDKLEDTDPEDNEPGTDLRDRPHGAGYGPSRKG
jgi:hypothetical protein